MLLVIDSGNTNVVFAIYSGKMSLGQWRCASDSKKTADEYAVWLTQLMALEKITPERIEGIVMSNVVPAVEYNLQTLCKRYFKKEPVTVAQALAHINLPIRISRPEQVGADRIANTVAAHADHEGPLIVVDFGTATTFDLVDEDGGYAGGVIAPGINLSMTALYNAAALLPRINVEKTQNIVGHDTASAMRSGVFWGYIGLIEGLISRINAERGRKHHVVATGGLAPLFADTTDAIHQVDGDLTLKGLLLLYAAVKQET
jgi:type III pantothenate kinase|tara:strand:+ start:3054 stop:3830 length:777 start_codon:yes stop_codon:yes gene_type:complete